MIQLISFVSVILMISPARAADMYGLFMVVKGDVKVTNVDNKTLPIKVGSKILPGETVISGAESRAKIVMSDRNVINISPGTTLKIEKYENKGVNKNVILGLEEGKARTNVEQKYDGDKSKFLMKTPTAVAGVRGTEFLVSYSSATQVTEVVTLKGAVSFAAAGAASDAMVVVKKGETASLTSGATTPEPPKIVPKEELKKIDKESTAQAGSSKPDEPKTRSTASESSGNKDGTKAEGASIEPGSAPVAGSAPSASTGTMIDRKDMDAGTLVRDVTGSTTAAPAPLPPPPRLAPVKPPPVVDGVLQPNFEKTKVKVIPVVN